MPSFVLTEARRSIPGEDVEFSGLSLLADAVGYHRLLLLACPHESTRIEIRSCRESPHAGRER